MNDLRISAIALDIQWADPVANLTLAEEIIKNSPKADIFVLPELFTTGFIADAVVLKQISGDFQDLTLDVIRRSAQSADAMIAGSYPAMDADGKCYNRGFMICPDGREVFYDKRHLFCLSAESRLFEHGKTPIPVIDFRGWNIAMMICYDLRFPVWTRRREAEYDCMLIPANWPQARAYAWEHLLIARAIENQAIVVGANRSGSDEYGEYDSLSYIFDAQGLPIGKTSKDYPIVTATASLDEVRKTRHRLPADSDADDFNLVL